MSTRAKEDSIIPSLISSSCVSGIAATYWVLEAVISLSSNHRSDQKVKPRRKLNPSFSFSFKKFNWVLEKVTCQLFINISISKVINSMNKLNNPSLEIIFSVLNISFVWSGTINSPYNIYNSCTSKSTINVETLLGPTIMCSPFTFVNINTTAFIGVFSLKSIDLIFSSRECPSLVDLHNQQNIHSEMCLYRWRI